MYLRLVGIGALGVIAVAFAAAGGPAGTAAQHTLEFRPVLTTLPRADPTAPSTDTAAAKRAVASCDAKAVAGLPSVPTTKPSGDAPGKCVVLPASAESRAGDTRYFLGPVGLDRDAVKSATSDFISGQGWTVTLKLTKSGAKAWDALAAQQFHAEVAMVFDHAVVSAPQIQPNDVTFTSFDGTAVISGAFSQGQADRLAHAVDR